MTLQFPAIIIGGPPNRGKSVFSALVSDSLRRRQVSHYRYQATPDGDGKWYNDIQDRALATEYRRKHEWNSYFEEVVEQIVRGRPVPFLVDVGGKPTRTQEELFSLATHAILLGADEAELAEWRAMMARQGLTVIAEVLSSLEGDDKLLEPTAPLRIVLTHLERGRSVETATSSAWIALVDKIESIFQSTNASVWEYHWSQLDSDILPFHAEQWLHFYASEHRQWEFEDLIALHETLDVHTPVAIFADYPTWVTPSVAIHLQAPLLCFDIRYGWIQIPTLAATNNPDLCPWQVHLIEGEGYSALRFRLHAPHIVHSDAIHALLPTPPHGVPIVLDGQMPRWLYAALALHYARLGYEVGIAIPRKNCAVLVNGNKMGRSIEWRPEAAAIG